MIVFIL